MVRRSAPAIYNVFVDLKYPPWTLVLSTQPNQPKDDPNDKVLLYGVVQLRSEVRRPACADEGLDFGGVHRAVHHWLRRREARSRRALHGVGPHDWQHRLHAAEVVAEYRIESSRTLRPLDNPGRREKTTVIRERFGPARGLQRAPHDRQRFAGLWHQQDFVRVAERHGPVAQRQIVAFDDDRGGRL